MADEKAKPKRVFVKITDEAKRRLIHLSVEAGASSVEEFGGRLLTAAIESAWASFDPKRQKKTARE